MEKIQKLKRSPNYTLEEKNNLLSIIAKYQNILDCKRTGAFFVHQKQAVWKSIVKEYNSICTTGPRTENMLKHFYNNIKHRARKDSAVENKKRYLEQLSPPIINEDYFTITSASSQAEPVILVEAENSESNVVNENLLEDLKKKNADDQKNIKKTGGGSFTPTLTEAEHQILSVLDTQIRPDVNPYDEASEYFGDNVEDNTKQQPNRKLNSSIQIQTKKKQMLQTKTISNRHSAEALKRIYFKKKIEVTYYQKKIELQRFRLERKKHQLEIYILKLQLEKAKKDLA